MQSNKAIILIALFWGSVCSAAPVVTSGTISSGVCTVGGASFGSKATAAPLHFDTFAEGTAGDTIGQHSTYWSDPTSADNRAYYSTDQVRVSGHKSAKATAVYSTGATGQLIKNNVGFSSTGKIYLNYWIRYDIGTSSGNYWQLKSFSICNSLSDNGDITYPQLSLFNFYYSADDKTLGYIANTWFGSGSNDQLNLINSSASNENVLRSQAWYNIIIQANQGTVGTADGSYSVSISAPSFSAPYGVNSRANTMVLGDATNTTNRIDALKIWAYHAPAPTVGGQAVHYFDGIYIDNSWARVELCDASTRSASAHCEIQIPTSWSTTSVATTFKQGAFSGGQQVYAYVTDEDGATNSTGYGPMTIPADGGGGGSTGHYYQARVSE